MNGSIKLRWLTVAALALASGLVYIVWPRPESTVPDGAVVLNGTVIRKPWRKTYESWNAGGSEYYVLDVGDVAIEHRSAKEGVILRPSDDIPFTDFAKYKDRQVVVRGEYVESKPWTPPPGYDDQYPTERVLPENYSPDDPLPEEREYRPAPRGSGFRVFSIRTVNRP